jgi:hypothetical protein
MTTAREDAKAPRPNIFAALRLCARHVEAVHGRSGRLITTPPQSVFVTTHWSVVLAAGLADSSLARAARLARAIAGSLEVTWIPTIAAMLVINASARSLTRGNPHFAYIVDLTVLLNLSLVLIAALIFAARRPTSGIQDYIAGTRLPL